MFARTFFTLSLMTGLAACTTDDSADQAESVSAIDQACRGGATRLQAGSLLDVLAIVNDRWMVFQDGSTIFASRLSPGAPRIALTDTTALPPEVLVSGGVVMIWPDQQQFGTTTPSRLVVWSEHTGIHVASTRTVVPTTTAVPGAVAVSPDGEQLLFIDNLAASASRGDIVLATTDLSHRTTVATDVDVDQNTVVCPPFVGFRGGYHAQPLAAFCAAGATGLTLRTIAGGAPRVLADNLLPFSVNVNDALVTAQSATGQPISISADGENRVLDPAPAGRVIPAAHGDALVFSAAGNGPFKRIHDSTPPRSTTVGSTAALGFFQNHRPIGGHPFYTDSFFSPDGRSMLAVAQADPAVPPDIQVFDTLGQRPAVSIGPFASCGTSFELFTPDSSAGLLYCADATGNFALFAGSATGVRQISSGVTAFLHFGISGSKVLYADNVTFGPTVATFDLKLADVLAPEGQTTLVAGVSTNFLVTRDRRSVLYSRDDAPETAGIYLSRTRPADERDEPVPRR